MEKAQAYDNSVTRMAMALDAARPFVAVKPKGYFDRVIGHYSSIKSAQAAANKWNKERDAV